MQSIKINLLKLAHACVCRIQGKAGKKACLVIPIEDAHLTVGEKGVYLDLLMYEMRERGQYGDTAFLRQSLPREVYDAMDEEQRKAQPILGNVKPVQAKAVQEAPDIPAASIEHDDDLPF